MPAQSPPGRTREGDLVVFLLIVPLVMGISIAAWDWCREAWVSVNWASMSLERQDAHSSRIIGPMHPLFWVIFGYIVWALPAGAAGAWFAVLSDEDKTAGNGAACAFTTGLITATLFFAPSMIMVESWAEFGIGALALLAIQAPAAGSGALCGWLRRRPGVDRAGPEAMGDPRQG